jgi:hypothetical protein
MLLAFLGVELAQFLLAGLTHRGVLLHGPAHSKAAIAETAIASVLGVGIAFCIFRPRSARSVGLLVQALALLAPLIGLFAIPLGIGPHSAPEVAMYALMLVTLTSGLSATV